MKLEKVSTEETKYTKHYILLRLYFDIFQQFLNVEDTFDQKETNFFYRRCKANTKI